MCIEHKEDILTSHEELVMYSTLKTGYILWRKVVSLTDVLCPQSREQKSVMRYWYAINNHKPKELQTLIARHAFVLQQIDDKGANGLIRAVIAQNYEAIAIFKRSGIEQNFCDQDGWSARTWALFLQDQEALRALRGLAIAHVDKSATLGWWLISAAKPNA